MENEDKISVSFYVANENKVAVMPESHMKLENFSYMFVNYNCMFTPYLPWRPVPTIFLLVAIYSLAFPGHQVILLAILNNFYNLGRPLPTEVKSIRPKLMGWNYWFKE